MNQLNGDDVGDLCVGMSASFSKTITEADLVLFAGVSGDNNAMHVDEEFAAATPFGGLWCNSPSPIGYAGSWTHRRLTMSELNSIEELFEGRHFDREVHHRVLRGTGGSS
jgi:hypothetical protein